MVEVPPISTEAGLEETVMVGGAIVIVVVPDTPPTVAVTFTLPSLRAVSVAVATPFALVFALAVTLPSVASLTVKVTALPAPTNVPLASLTVAMMEEVCVRLMVAGEAKTVTEPISAMVTSVVPVAVPTVAVIVSFPTADAVNVFVTVPDTVVALVTMEPSVESLNEKVTVWAVFSVLPAASFKVTVISDVLEPEAVPMDVDVAVTTTTGGETATVVVPEAVPEVAVTFTLPSATPVNVAVAIPLVVVALVVTVPSEVLSETNVTVVPLATAAPKESVTVADIVVVPVISTVAEADDTETEAASDIVKEVVALVVPTVALIVTEPLPLEVNVAVATPPVVVALAGIVPRVGTTVIANVTAVPSVTGLPLPSNAVTFIVEVEPV